MNIGSVVWRFLNYSPIASAKYLIKRGKNIVLPYEIVSRYTRNSEQLEIMLNLEAGSVSKATDEVVRVITEYETQFRNRFPSFATKKVFGQDLSVNRLLIIKLLISTGDYDHFIETGTQFGLSSYIAAQSFDFLGMTNRSISFDVTSTDKIENTNVTYKLLNFPVRYNFKKQIKAFSNLQNIIFFHDSDHSYENMYFEFQTIWQYPNYKCIISDDVQPNHAFLDFCSKNNLVPSFFQQDEGPLVGFVIR